MNMRHTVIHATAIAIALAALPVLAQQTETTETTTTTTVKQGNHEYIYYGDHDIYFAPQTRTYYWQEGDAWRSGTELPQASRSYITNGGVKIQLDTERPYERNEWVIKHYKHGQPVREDDGDHR